MHLGTHNLTSRIQLGRNHGTMFHAARGTMIVSEQGEILVSEGTDFWCGPTFVTHFLIVEGECHVVQRGGWVRLQPGGIESAASLILIGAKTVSVPLWQRWWRWAIALPTLKE